MKKILNKNLIAIQVLLVIVCLAMLSNCTKYSTYKSSSSSTGSSSSSSGSNGISGVAPTPLPPPGTGTNTGSGNSGSSGNTGNSNLPQSYVQALFFTSLNQQYVRANDSVTLNFDGSYTPLYSGYQTFKFLQGTGTTSDAQFTKTTYFLKPYSYYSYALFKTPAASVNETLLYNDLATPAVGKANIRFISIDPLTSTAPVSFSIANFYTVNKFPNRTYLDHITDSSKMGFITFDAGTYNVGFSYRDSSMLTFTYNFESGKLYTVFAGALAYTSSTKGIFPISFYQVARHN